MTMAARITPGSHAPCPSTAHGHPMPCEGCGADCGPDDFIRTTTRLRWICSPCYARHRDAWMRKPEKDARIAAVTKAVRS